jgi:hypothetical protein
MAFSALRDSKVSAMAEEGWPGLFNLIGNILNRVARDTRSYAECFPTIMAGTTRLPFCHICHGEALG